MDNKLAHDAIERAYQNHAMQLWRAVYAFSGGRADVADDSVAEAFARAIAHSDRISTPLPWLFRVALRHATTAMRKERRQSDLAKDKGDGSSGTPHADSIGLLAILPPNQRVIVFLHYYVDMSIHDIARVRGTSQVNVRVQLHRARQALRRRYESAAAMAEDRATEQGGKYGRVA